MISVCLLSFFLSHRERVREREIIRKNVTEGEREGKTDRLRRQ